MTATVVAVVLLAVLAAAAVALRRAGNRVTCSVLGLAAVFPALIVARNLPGPLIDALLVAALIVIAGVTAWPVLRPQPADRPGRGGGGS